MGVELRSELETGTPLDARSNTKMEPSLTVTRSPAGPGNPGRGRHGGRDRTSDGEHSGVPEVDPIPLSGEVDLIRFPG